MTDLEKIIAEMTAKLDANPDATWDDMKVGFIIVRDWRDRLAAIVAPAEAVAYVREYKLYGEIHRELEWTNDDEGDGPGVYRPLYYAAIAALGEDRP